MYRAPWGCRCAQAYLKHLQYALYVRVRQVAAPEPLASLVQSGSDFFTLFTSLCSSLKKHWLVVRQLCSMKMLSMLVDVGSGVVTVKLLLL